MLSVSSRVCLARRLPTSFVRYASAQREVLSKDILQAENAISKQLLATNVWKPHRSKARATVKGEKTRINITGDKLCSTHAKLLPLPVSLVGANPFHYRGH